MNASLRSHVLAGSARYRRSPVVPKRTVPCSISLHLAAATVQLRLLGDIQRFRVPFRSGKLLLVFSNLMRLKLFEIYYSLNKLVESYERFDYQRNQVGIIKRAIKAE